MVARSTAPSQTRRATGTNVFDAAVERLVTLYEQGHRLVYSFSAGKDSGVCIELGIVAARLTNRLPIDVVLRDEEVMFPGTYEYAERTFARPEVRGRWLIANQPVINVCNRALPYFWTFDPVVGPEQWVRQPPIYAEVIPDKNIERMTTPERFPPAPGKKLYAVLGIRTSESRGRMYGLFSAKGHITHPKASGVSSVWPIYDWSDSDVWLAHRRYGWDYNRAYDALFRLGVPRGSLRIAPPTMNAASVALLRLASYAWPAWFDRVCDRLPGVRQVALFGNRALTPQRRSYETWEETFRRECLGPQVPEWIRERAIRWSDRILSAHAHHSAGQPLPQTIPCHPCFGNSGCWRGLTLSLWNGDPFSVKCSLPYVEPEFFRAGAGTWGGKPAF